MQSSLYFSRLIAQHAATTPNQTALVDRDRKLTFKELHESVSRLAGGLESIGVKSGDRVALWLPNSIAWVQSFLACAYLGAVVLAINTRYREQEVGDMLGRGGADWLVLWPDFKGIPFADILDRIPDDQLVKLKGIVRYGENYGASDMPVAMLRDRPTFLFASLVDSDPKYAQAFSGNEGVITFSTSGTTSLPKFVLHGQQGLIEHGLAVATSLAYDEETTVFASAPYCGAFGFATLVSGLAGGVAVVSEPVFSAKGAVKMIHECRVTHTFANNESIAQMLEACDAADDLASARYFGFASFTPAADSFIKLADRNNLPVAGLYGSSELNALVAAQPLDCAATRYLAGGKLTHPDARVRCRDQESGMILAPGQSGEIEIFSPCLMLGYLDNPESTQRVLTIDGYFRTGDLGYTVSDRQFVFQARMGDSFRLAGFLVNPAEIEAVVETLPEIKACQVVGATHGGKVVPFAFVLLKPDASADSIAWETACKQRMAGFKVPVRFEVLEEFPVIQSANALKVQKGRLRDMADELLAGRALADL